MNLTKELIQQNWPINNISDIHPLQQQGERIVYRVTGEKGSFTFKIVDHSKTEQQLQQDTEVFDFLERYKFPAPCLLRSKNDKDYVQIENKFVIALTYIDGVVPQRTPGNHYKLGETIADLHSLPNIFPHESSFTFSTEIPAMLQRAGRSQIGHQYVELVEELPDFKDLTDGLIHTDLRLGNTILTSKGELVVIDWDDAGRGPILLDLGYPLICAFVTDNLEFRKENAEAYYQGYFSKRELNRLQKDLIYYAGLFYSLSYCIEDWNNYRVNELMWQKAQFAVKNKELIKSVI